MIFDGPSKTYDSKSEERIPQPVLDKRTIEILLRCKSVCVHDLPKLELPRI